jgi:cystathionine beta-lyase
VESAKLWAISVSFGCVNSLISMPCRMSHASIDAKTRLERAMPEDLIRLCVGIEDVDDLIDDLRRAVSRHFRSNNHWYIFANVYRVQLVQAGAVNVTLDDFQAVEAGSDQSSEGETPAATS